ncbi:hypothetical protein ISTM_323 [Insectomime virus]|uniref:Uncharacterized protein n=1 Tax=Tunisvirus fontaine2 TaxID=1421067 RepID=V9SGZ9_9VIRU|nr:hypothetical protein D1R32_gp477 [Tunisvirus fontaine2]AHA46221.1 hypothetical protein ISTM_323 [Insectomime virus]AHC55194.1 hypothetical protein TNS_ORF476 [Tunisvirus fontaine2]
MNRIPVPDIFDIFSWGIHSPHRVFVFNGSFLTSFLYNLWRGGSFIQRPFYDAKGLNVIFFSHSHKKTQFRLHLSLLPSRKEVRFLKSHEYAKYLTRLGHPKEFLDKSFGIFSSYLLSKDIYWQRP